MVSNDHKRKNDGGRGADSGRENLTKKIRTKVTMRDFFSLILSPNIKSPPILPARFSQQSPSSAPSSYACPMTKESKASRFISKVAAKLPSTSALRPSRATNQTTSVSTRERLAPANSLLNGPRVHTDAAPISSSESAKEQEYQKLLREKDKQIEALQQKVKELEIKGRDQEDAIWAGEKHGTILSLRACGGKCSLTRSNLSPPSELILLNTERIVEWYALKRSKESTQWLCPETQCTYSNFATRTTCKRCGVTKPAQTATGANGDAGLFGTGVSGPLVILAEAEMAYGEREALLLLNQHMREAWRRDQAHDAGRDTTSMPYGNGEAYSVLKSIAWEYANTNACAQTPRKDIWRLCDAVIADALEYGPYYYTDVSHNYIHGFTHRGAREFTLDNDAYKRCGKLVYIVFLSRLQSQLFRDGGPIMTALQSRKDSLCAGRTWISLTSREKDAVFKLREAQEKACNVKEEKVLECKYHNLAVLVHGRQLTTQCPS